MSAILQQLTEIDRDEAVHTRQSLLPHIAGLQAAGLDVWRAALSQMHTRFNKYLFLNAPELWNSLSVTQWAQIMGSVERSYAPGDVFSTGRFDDIKFLCHFVGVDALQIYFEHARLGPREASTRWVRQHVHACSFMYLPMTDAAEELEDMEVTSAQLLQYRLFLQRTWPSLQPAKVEVEQLLRAVGG